jgi:hypothetical protein
MKKFISLLLVFSLVISVFCMPAWAQNNETATPYYVNTSSARTTLTISENGEASILVYCLGLSNVTSIKATTYLEKMVNGTWYRVDIDQPNDQWVNTTSSRIFTATRTHQLTSTGIYRAVTLFVVTAGSAESIILYSQATY